MRVFVDMDGVLTAFNRQLGELLYKSFPERGEVDITPKMWDKIAKAGEDFWAKMEWLPDGHKLWDEIKKYDPTILSAPTKESSSIEGKKIWLKKELPGVPYLIESKKEKHANSESILIDDREENIKKWKKAGGIGILHKNAEDTITELTKIMSKEKKASMDIINRIVLKYAAAEIAEPPTTSDSDFLKFFQSPLMKGKSFPGQEKRMAPRSPIHDVGSERVKIVLDTLRDSKNPKLTPLWSKINEYWMSTSSDPNEALEAKKDLRNLAFSTGDTDVAEFINLMILEAHGAKYKEVINDMQTKKRDILEKTIPAHKGVMQQGALPKSTNQRWEEFIKDPSNARWASEIIRIFLKDQE